MAAGRPLLRPQQSCQVSWIISTCTDSWALSAHLLNFCWFPKFCWFLTLKKKKKKKVKMYETWKKWKSWAEYCKWSNLEYYLWFLIPKHNFYHYLVFLVRFIAVWEWGVMNFHFSFSQSFLNIIVKFPKSIWQTINVKTHSDNKKSWKEVVIFGEICTNCVLIFWKKGVLISDDFWMKWLIYRIFNLATLDPSRPYIKVIFDLLQCTEPTEPILQTIVWIFLLR